MVNKKKFWGELRNFGPPRSPTQITPEEIAQMRAQCPVCNLKVAIDWHEPLGEPRVPIASIDGGGHWVCVSFPITCPLCRTTFDYKVDTIKDAKPFPLYGDEAFRELDGIGVFVYALIGGSPSAKTAIERRLIEAKSRLLPDVDPATWILHMKNLWPGSERSRQPLFSNLKKKDIEQFTASVSAILRESYPEIFRCVFSTVAKIPSREKGAFFESLRDRSFSSLVWLMIDITRNNKFRLVPQFYFDATKPLVKHSNIEGWAGNLFLGAQCTRLHVYLSAGRTILPPKALQPGSDPLLELADFLAYVSARWLIRRIAKAEPDIDLAAIGPALFAGFDRTGDLRFQWATEFPYGLFFE
jgi:hypothetical protein